MTPDSMTVIEMRGAGGPEVLVPGRRPVPEPKPSELLLRVTAVGVNGPDLVQRRGHYPPPKGASDLLGLEASGEVVATGRRCKQMEARRPRCRPDERRRICRIRRSGGRSLSAAARDG